MTPLEADLQPGLARVARRLQRLQGEAARLPQSFRRAAEAALPQRLQAFRATWHRLLSFSSPAAARAAAALQRKAEAALDALPDQSGRHERLAAYERALQTLARGVNDPARYQVLLRLEQRHFDSRDFARFTRRHVESRLAAPGAPGNGRPPPGQALAQLEARSQWLQAHRLAVHGLLQEAGSDWRAGDRERILDHLAFDLRFLVRAIAESYKPETYTPDVLRDRIRAYAALAAALEPAALAGGDVIDSAFGNLTGSSARGALRFEVVDRIARAEARLRLAPSAAALPLADLLRAERNLIAVYQNASEDRYVQALLGLWQEADRRPERGARISALALAAHRGRQPAAEGALRTAPCAPSAGWCSGRRTRRWRSPACAATWRASTSRTPPSATPTPRRARNSWRCRSRSAMTGRRRAAACISGARSGRAEPPPARRKRRPPRRPLKASRREALTRRFVATLQGTGTP